MTNLVRMKFGSHLYGTDTPASDLDFKSVYLPEREAILLQRVKGSISTKREKAEGEKNLAGEIDEESYSLQRYLGLLTEGQTVALDMLFAPPYMWLDSSATWRFIVANRERLLSRKSAAFVGYCRQQANKYGIKGSRVSTMRDAITLLTGLETKSALGHLAKLGEFDVAFAAFVASHKDHSALVDMDSAGKVLRHFEVCGRKLPYTIHLKNAREVLEKIFSEYGQRALAAEKHDGIDWKALSHAVRVGYEAVELMETAHITFPLPNAAHVLAVKKAEIPYKDVAQEIEGLLDTVESVSKRSILPEKPDMDFVDEIVLAEYGKICRM